MQTSSTALDRFKRELKLKELWENQVRDSEYTAAECIYELFAPYLDILRENIKKANYELSVNAFINERLLNLTEKETVVELSFEWEPLYNQGKQYIYHEVTFTPTQRRYVRKCLSDFSAAIGYTTKLG